MIYRKQSLILVLVLVPLVSVAAAAVVFQKSKTTSASADQQPLAEAVTPLVDFNTPEPSDPEERALRRKRGRRHDYHGDPADVRRFVLGEQSAPVALDLPISGGPVENPIPVQQSDAIVIGKVVDAHAYLSNDRTNVYSEFSVLVEDVLKNNRGASLYTGAHIATERRGGSVRLPSGRTLVRGALGRTMPRAGGRYALFLKRDEEGDTYSIVTGYELRGGKVLPLDGASSKHPQLAPFGAYVNADELTLLNKVREAVASPAEREQPE